MCSFKSLMLAKSSVRVFVLVLLHIQPLISEFSIPWMTPTHETFALFWNGNYYLRHIFVAIVCRNGKTPQMRGETNRNKGKQKPFVASPSSVCPMQSENYEGIASLLAFEHGTNCVYQNLHCVCDCICVSIYVVPTCLLYCELAAYAFV